jgi:hypothetical protein
VDVRLAVDFRVMDRKDWLMALLDGTESQSGPLGRMLDVAR